MMNIITLGFNKLCLNESLFISIIPFFVLIYANHTENLLWYQGGVNIIKKFFVFPTLMFSYVCINFHTTDFVHIGIHSE